jgi:plastocyanin
MRKTIALAGGLLAALAVGVPVALAGATATTSASHSVVVKNFAFKPGRLSIRKGDSVTWRFQDGSTPHNVTGKGFHSPTRASGSYTFRFTKLGTFSYTCTIHPWMTGSIVVHR